jgi:hypothetical protein
MVDILDETVAQVDSKPSSVYVQELDWLLADSLSASLPAPSLDEVMTEQTERRKLRPMIVGIGFMALVGVGVVAVHVLRASKAHSQE